MSIISFILLCLQASAASITYTYDGLNRLKKADYGNGTYIEYTYDAAGNRLGLVSYSSGGGSSTSLPSVSTGSASSIGENSATLSATVNPNGLSTTAWFEYGTTTSYGTASISTSVGSGSNAASVSLPVISLSTATTYHFRVVAQNSAGTSYGGDQTFTTSSTSCTYSIYPTSVSFDGIGGSGSVSVSASNSSCSWTATESLDWVLISSGSSGSGSGTVSYKALNSSTSEGTMTIAGQIFTITVSGYTPPGSDTTAPTTTASPVGGTFTSAQSVTLTASESATIYYTTDGSIPTMSSAVYSSPLTISSSTTLNFFAVDAAGNIEVVKTEGYTITPLITTLIGGSIQGTPLTLIDTNAVVTTFAGSAAASGSTDGTGSSARFTNPTGITTDGGNLFIADMWNHTIRKIVISTGAVTTIAGSTGISGSSDGTGSAAKFYGPAGITTDGTNLYVADSQNHTIRKIIISTGVVTTIAGSPGLYGSTDGTGSAARFNYPRGVTTDGINVFVADYGNHTIRKIVIATGDVTTIAGSAGLSGSGDGTGSTARFNSPNDITTDGTNLFVADTNNYTIRKIVISTGDVVTIVGSAGLYGSTDGIGPVARFYNPAGLITDGTNLFVADGSNFTIRKVVLSTDTVTTIAGSSGVSGSVDGTGSASRFNLPRGITTDGTNLFVTDWNNNTIRKISPAITDSTAPATTASPAGGTYTSAQSVTLSCSDRTGYGCDKIYYTTDGTTPTTVYTSPIAISANTTLKFFAKDLAGNSEEVKTETYTISTGNSDTMVPTGSISINNGATYANSISVTLYLNASDSAPGGQLPVPGAVTGYYVSENSITPSGSASGWTTISSSASYSASVSYTLSSGDGTKTVYVWYKDYGGNVSSTYSDSIILDPTASTTTAAPAGGTYSSAQSVTLTCSDGIGSGCDKIYYTTDGSTPTTASTVYSNPISISATMTLKFFAVDLAGNQGTVKTELYTIDAAAPVFTSTSPQSDSFINTANVGYALSQEISSGTVTFTRTGGTADSTSHVYNFTSPDITAGSHSINTGLVFVNGTIYTVTFDATDAAGNAGSVSNTSVTYDTTTASVTISSPAANSVTNNAKVSYTMSEDISAGDIAFTRTGGSSDGMSPYTYTLGASERTAGSHTVDTGKVLMDGAIYTVSFENIKDMAGNQTASISTTNVTYDSTSVAITGTSPASNSIITNATIGYTLSEQAQSGRITFTWTGGTADGTSPHIYAMTSSDLTAGSHTVTTGLTLTDGSFYTVTFEATDLIGNPATTVSNAMIYYDSGYGTGPIGNVDSSGASAMRVDGFDLIKLSLAFGSKSGDTNWNPACDLDNSGVVEGNDLIVLGSHFGEVE